MQTLKKNQDEFNRQLFADKDKFSQLAYLSIFDADSVKMMLNGQVELYEELRKELLFNVHLLHWILRQEKFLQ